MTDRSSRRDFLGQAALASVAAVSMPHLRRIGPQLADGGTDTGPFAGSPAGAVRPFPLRAVRLLPGLYADAAELNRKYMLAVEPDRLLHTFRRTVDLPTSAQPLGGWEAPENELRGHSTGHYLSGCALRWAAFGDEEMKRRGDYLVTELAKCQERLGNGYLSAFPEEFFDRLRADVRVWAPFYTLHKIMAGLRDMHTQAENAQAKDVLLGMSRWVDRWSQPLGPSHMQRVLEREYGGMNEILLDVHAITGGEQWLEVASRFDHERVFDPLAAGRDELKGLHVNTLIPKVIGAARRYELTGDQRSRDIAEYFWNEVTSRRTYCTGGTSNGESWNVEPGQMSKELSGYTQECCVTYNMLRLSKHVFQWTADPRVADYFERAMINGILGTQHPSDGHNLYYVPLQSGYWKLFGRFNESFWCCNGSAMESFGKLGEAIYFHDDRSIYVNQFIPSELTWSEKNVTIRQETRIPEGETTRLSVTAAAPVRFAMRLRVPYWATQGGRVTLNGMTIDAFAGPSSYLVIDREWKSGDVLEMALPMSLHLHAMPDNRAIAAVMYGPTVLAGRMGAEGLTPNILRAEATRPRTVPEYKGEPTRAPDLRKTDASPDQWLRPVQGRVSTFVTTSGQPNVEMIPLYRVLDERYAVYWSFV